MKVKLLKKSGSNDHTPRCLNLISRENILSDLNNIAEISSELSVGDHFLWELNALYIKDNDTIYLTSTGTGAFSINRFLFEIDVENAMRNMDIENGTISISQVGSIPPEYKRNYFRHGNINESEIPYKKYMYNRELDESIPLLNDYPIFKLDLTDDDFIFPITLYMNGYGDFYLSDDTIGMAEVIVDEALSLMLRIERLPDPVISSEEESHDSSND